MFLYFYFTFTKANSSMPIKHHILSLILADHPPIVCVQAEKKRWDKEPMKHACEAYLNARKELSILLTLHHEHIVPLVGVSLHPLCLLLSLAPHGALNTKLMDYQRAGARLPPYAVRDTVLQVSAQYVPGDYIWKEGASSKMFIPSQ